MKLLPPPGSTRRRPVILLLAAIVILGLSVLWWWGRPTEMSPAASNPDARAPIAVTGLPLPDAVKFDALSAVDEGADAGRNPFAFGARPAPPAPVLPPELSRPAPAPVAPTGPPPISLRLTGITVLPDSGRTMVTLRDPASSTLFQAFEGDVVDGRYRVVRVGPQSVVLSYLDGSGTRTVVLGG